MPEIQLKLTENAIKSPFLAKIASGLEPDDIFVKQLFKFRKLDICYYRVVEIYYVVWKHKRGKKDGNDSTPVFQKNN